jgi:hypothetical protein
MWQIMRAYRTSTIPAHTLMLNCSWCLQSIILSVITHKLNVSGHLFLVFACGIHAQNFSSTFIYILYMVYLLEAHTSVLYFETCKKQNCCETLIWISVSYKNAKTHTMDQFLWSETLDWRGKLQDAFVPKASCYQVSVILEFIMDAYCHGSSRDK